MRKIYISQKLVSTLFILFEIEMAFRVNPFSAIERIVPKRRISNQFDVIW